MTYKDLKNLTDKEIEALPKEDIMEVFWEMYSMLQYHDCM